MRFGSAPLAMRVAVPAMVRGDAVILAQIDADAGRDRLLPDRDMQRPGNFARLVRLERGLLEGADARHGAIEAGQAAEIVARFAHGCRPEERAACAGGFGMFEHAAKSTRRNVPAPQATQAPLTRQNA